MEEDNEILKRYGERVGYDESDLESLKRGLPSAPCEAFISSRPPIHH